MDCETLCGVRYKGALRLSVFPYPLFSERRNCAAIIASEFKKYYIFLQAFFFPLLRSWFDKHHCDLVINE